jgi:hypothetical protein
MKRRRSASDTDQVVSLTYLLGRLLQSALRSVYAPVALVDVLLHFPQVVKLEAPRALLVLRSLVVLGLERFIVYLGARAKVLLGICEEIVGTLAGEVGFADFGVDDANLRCALIRAGHELFAHELLKQPPSLRCRHGES